MSKTTPSYRETKYRTLSISEIEGIIFDNLVQAKTYIFRNYKELDFSVETLCYIHNLEYQEMISYKPGNT